MSRIISIASAQDTVGKTALAMNLAYCLQYKLAPPCYLQTLRLLLEDIVQYFAQDALPGTTPQPKPGSNGKEKCKH